MSAPAVAMADPLAPIRATLRAMQLRPGGPAVNGIAPALTLRDTSGWVSAHDLVQSAQGEDGLLDDLLDTAKQRWRATPHAAAALAFKCYSFWVALPAVLGYAVDRRVPLMRPENVAVRWEPHQPFLTVGLSTVEVAVLATDPLAAASRTARRAAGVTVVADEQALLVALRESLLDEHLSPLVDGIRGRLHVGRRTLLGSVASGIAHGLSRAADVVPGSTLATATQLLTAFDLADLVELSPQADGGPGINVQRRTCCLAFTLAEPKICTGCCIR